MTAAQHLYLGCVFGAIHCIAWSFLFATLPERWAWRISAILISGLPISIIAFSGLLRIFDKKEHKTAGMELYEDILLPFIFDIYGLALYRCTDSPPRPPFHGTLLSFTWCIMPSA